MSSALFPMAWFVDQKDWPTFRHLCTWATGRLCDGRLLLELSTGLSGGRPRAGCMQAGSSSSGLARCRDDSCSAVSVIMPSTAFLTSFAFRPVVAATALYAPDALIAELAFMSKLLVPKLLEPKWLRGVPLNFKCSFVAFCSFRSAFGFNLIFS